MSNFDTTMSNNSTIPYHNISHKRRAKTPSFSSILLDTIYRSIDDTDPSPSQPNHTPITTATTTTTTTTKGNNYDYIQASKQRRTKMRSDSTLETVDLRHAIMIESWMEKQTPQPKPTQKQRSHYCDNRRNNANCNDNLRITRQRSVPSRSRPALDGNSVNSSNFASTNSTSSSSRFTNLAPRSTDNCLRFDTVPKREPSKMFTKTKSRALKIYSDLKKPKQLQPQQQQPVSPGARIAAFLNSIFRNAASVPARSTPENPAAVTTPSSMSISTSTPSSCSTASSYARSCLSKNTTSTEKSKRSVRFYPVSVIVDEDSKPCGQKSLCRNDNKLHNDFDHINNGVGDDHKLLLSSKAAASDHQQHQPKKWKREKEIDALMIMIKRNCTSHNGQEYKEIMCFDTDSDDEMVDVEDEEDGESCASSDLFELENLGSIGVSRFSQELPVYGTTSLKDLTA